MVKIPYSSEYALLQLMSGLMGFMAERMVGVAAGLWLPHIFQKVRSVA